MSSLARPIARHLTQPRFPGWATIGTVNGAASDVVYDALPDDDLARLFNVTRWRCVQWTASHASGLVLATPGLVHGFVLGGGGSGLSYGGQGGGHLDGLLWLAGGTVPVVVGAAGWSNGSSATTPGGISSLGSWACRRALSDSGTINTSSPTSVSSAITGTLVEYGIDKAASPRAGFGDGGRPSTLGTAGRVIIRVPIA